MPEIYLLMSQFYHWSQCCMTSSLPHSVIPCYFISCIVYGICVCLRIVVSDTYCVVFVYCFSSSCVPYAASFSGLFIFGCPFGILFHLIIDTYSIAWHVNAWQMFKYPLIAGEMFISCQKFTYWCHSFTTEASVAWHRHFLIKVSYINILR
jgi:hypothetical protein